VHEGLVGRLVEEQRHAVELEVVFVVVVCLPVQPCCHQQPLSHTAQRDMYVTQRIITIIITCIYYIEHHGVVASEALCF